MQLLSLVIDLRTRISKLSDKWETVLEIVLLKELRNYNRRLFLCPPQKQAKTQADSKLLFLKINIHFDTSDQICAYQKLKSSCYDKYTKLSKTKFFSHNQYLFGLLFCRNAKKDSNRPKYTINFVTLSEKKLLTNL